MILWMAFLHKIIMKTFLKLIIGAQFYLNKSLLENKQFIIVANHFSHVDTAAILSMLPWKKVYKVHPVAARDYFGKNILTTLFFKFTMNVLLIDRKSNDKNKAINDMLNSLDEGHSLIIFPEGSRSSTEKMSEFKGGIVKLLKLRPNIPYIPVLIQDSLMILPKGDPIVVPHNFNVIVGQAQFLNLTQSDHENLDEIKKQIEMLSIYLPGTK